VAFLEYTVDSQVALITLTSQPAGNVLNRSSLELLQSAIDQAVADKQVRVIVLRAQGDPFCLGMDLAMVQQVHQHEADARKTIALYVSVLTSISVSPKPVICLVQGAVKAGGVGLVAACDIVLATEQASMELSEVLLGLIPANVAPFVCGVRLPLQKMKYLILTAKKLTAIEAQRLNLMDEVFPVGQLAAGAKAIVKNLLRSSPDALSETKHFFREIHNETHDQSLALAQDKLLEMIKTPQVIQAIQAFNEGMTPDWFIKYQPEKPLVLEGRP
jgi:enoyl-CoA hydratase/carnithine racemase